MADVFEVPRLSLCDGYRASGCPPPPSSINVPPTSCCFLSLSFWTGLWAQRVMGRSNMSVLWTINFLLLLLLLLTGTLSTELAEQTHIVDWCGGSKGKSRSNWRCSSGFKHAALCDKLISSCSVMVAKTSSGSFMNTNKGFKPVACGKASMQGVSTPSPQHTVNLGVRVTVSLHLYFQFNAASWFLVSRGGGGGVAKTFWHLIK